MVDFIVVLGELFIMICYEFEELFGDLIFVEI